MKIGLIDVDGHHFPNLALMRISAWHKAQGDDVEWRWSDLIHYDIVYMSKIFSDAYSPDIPEPLNADVVIKGGTGYCISFVNGREVFDESKNNNLPDEMEHTWAVLSPIGCRSQKRRRRKQNERTARTQETV